MIITAKFSSICPVCDKSISAGDKVEWSKGHKASHAACGASTAASAPRASASSRTWDADAFRGYGRPRGRFVRACPTGGNCSSFGSGTSCGAPDCDGW